LTTCGYWLVRPSKLNGPCWWQGGAAIGSTAWPWLGRMPAPASRVTSGCGSPGATALTSEGVPLPQLAVVKPGSPLARWSNAPGCMYGLGRLVPGASRIDGERLEVERVGRAQVVHALATVVDRLVGGLGGPTVLAKKASISRV